MKKGKGSKTAKRADFDIVLSAIRKYLDAGDWRSAILLAIPLFTGLRISEWSKITWSQVLSGELIVAISKDRKTGKVRKIAFSDNAKAIFLQCWHRTGYYNKEMLVFKTPYMSRRQKPYSQTWLNEKIDEICHVEKWPHYTSHSFRKAWGYKMYLALGANQEALLLLQRAFNHSDTQTTIIYLGLADDQIQEAMMTL
jgi:integrase